MLKIISPDAYFVRALVTDVIRRLALANLELPFLSHFLFEKIKSSSHLILLALCRPSNVGSLLLLAVPETEPHLISLWMMHDPEGLHHTC